MWVPRPANTRRHHPPPDNPVGAPLEGALSRQYAPSSPSPQPPRRGTPCGCPFPPIRAIITLPSPPPHGHPLWVPFPANTRHHPPPLNPPVGAPLVAALPRPHAPSSPSPHHPRMDTPCGCPPPPIRAVFTLTSTPPHGHPLWLPSPAPTRRLHPPLNTPVGAPLVGAISRQYAPPSPSPQHPKSGLHPYRNPKAHAVSRIPARSHTVPGGGRAISQRHSLLSWPTSRPFACLRGMIGFADIMIQTTNIPTRQLPA